MTTFSDDFAVDGPLSSNWTQPTKGMTCGGGEATNANTGVGGYAAWTGSAIGLDQFSRIRVGTVVTDTKWVFPCVRAIISSNLFYGYVAEIDGTDCRVFKVLSEIYGTPLATFSLPCVADDLITLEATGNTPTTLVVKKNGAQVGSAIVDSSSPINVGTPGISTYAGGTIRDVFGGDIVAGLAAAASDVASSAAALTSAVQMSASVSSRVASTAGLTTAVRLAAAAVDTVVSSGSLNTGAMFAGAALDVAAAVAALTTAVRFNGAAIDVAVATGALINWATVTLSGALYTGQGSIVLGWTDSAPQVGTTLYYDATHVTIYPNGEVSSDVPDCLAEVQFFDGTSWANGTIMFTSGLAGVARDQVGAAAQLSSAIQLAAAANALATASAAFATGAGLAAAASGTATASGTLSTAIPLSALAQSVANASAALTAQIKLAADAAGTSSAHADLNGVIVLNAAAVSLASASAGLTSGVQLGGAAQDSAIGSGALTTAIRLAGAAQDAANAIAALTATIRLGGAAQSTVQATADLQTARLLTAAAIDATIATAILATGISLDAHAGAVSLASAALTTKTEFMAGAAAQATVTAVLTDVIETPPVGEYIADSRFIVSRSAGLIGTRVTPRFPAKGAASTHVLTFDFADQLEPGEALKGRITITVRCVAGIDPGAPDMLLGVPSYDPTMTRILQPVGGGVAGATYLMCVTVGTTTRFKTVDVNALMPVR